MFRRTGVELLSVAILPLGIALAVQDSREPNTAAAPYLPTSTAGPVSYSGQIVPIFAANCADCHGAITQEVGLSLATYEEAMTGSEYGSVIEAGDPDASLLVEMLEAGEMPQDADPIPPEQIELIRSWIAAGAENN